MALRVQIVLYRFTSNTMKQIYSNVCAALQGLKHGMLSWHPSVHVCSVCFGKDVLPLTLFSFFLLAQADMNCSSA